MRMMLRRRFILAVPLLSPAPSVAAGWEGPFTLAVLFSNLAAVPERRARFTEERRFAALDQTLHSQGRLLWRRPDILEKHTESPEPESLRIAGEQVEVSRPGQPSRSVSLAAQPQLRAFVEALRAPLAGDLATMERLFEASLNGAPAAWQLRLVPRDPRMRQAMAAMEFEGALAEPREILLRQHNGDTQLLRIETLP